MSVATAAERALHARLLATNDPVASSDLVVAYLDRLAGLLERLNPRVDSHMCQDAAEDAILALIKNPGSYDPNKMSLEAYLRMSAKGDLRNVQHKEARHATRRADLEDVELLSTVRNKQQDADDDPIHILIRREEEEEAMHARPVSPVPESVLLGLSAEETSVLKLMRRRERKTVIYARALGIVDQPFDEQKRIVKRAKDKLWKRMQRAGGGHERPD
jgi:Sigma-70 region 2